LLLFLQKKKNLLFLKKRSKKTFGFCAASTLSPEAGMVGPWQGLGCGVPFVSPGSPL
jgi:hypothetical protein